MERALIYDHEVLESICRKYHVRRLELFGSWAKGEPHTASDVDIVVDYDPQSGMTVLVQPESDSWVRN
jgi:hypothetical protein